MSNRNDLLLYLICCSMRRDSANSFEPLIHIALRHLNATLHSCSFAYSYIYIRNTNAGNNPEKRHNSQSIKYSMVTLNRDLF
jgi:hypothetical protein